MWLIHSIILTPAQFYKWNLSFKRQSWLIVQFRLKVTVLIKPPTNMPTLGPHDYESPELKRSPNQRSEVRSGGPKYLSAFEVINCNTRHRLHLLIMLGVFLFVDKQHFVYSWVERCLESNIEMFKNLFLFTLSYFFSKLNEIFAENELRLRNGLTTFTVNG